MEYIKIRDMLRNPKFQKELLAKSLQERANIAANARNQSKKHTRQTKIDIMDVTQEEVVTSMKKNGSQLLIHGHTHRPDVHNVPQVNGQRVVLGDWDSHGWFLELTKEGFSLESFPIG